MRALTITITLLLASGCSFVQDWGDLRPDDFDAGPMGVDAGPTGVDAGDPCGDGDACLRCAFDEVCYFDPALNCDTCVPDGFIEGEGEPCAGADECAAGLICHAAEICVLPCDTSQECIDQSFFGALCTDPGDGSGGYCLDAHCELVDPTVSDCPGVCGPVGWSEDGEVATLCFEGTPTVGVGDVCDPTADICPDHFLCIDDGSGVGRCTPFCYVGAGMCPTGMSCVGLASPTGGLAYFRGAELGLCFPGDACAGTACAAGEHCDTAGICVISCTTDADCGGGSSCGDWDGDGWLECG